MAESPVKKATPLNRWRDSAFSQRCILIGRGAMIRAGSNYDDASVLNRIIHNGCRNNGTASTKMEGSIKTEGCLCKKRRTLKLGKRLECDCTIRESVESRQRSNWDETSSGAPSFVAEGDTKTVIISLIIRKPR